MLNRHRLSVRDFDSLATGFGSATTLASLSTTQFSRRLIGLRAVLDAADRAGCASASGYTAGWELLQAVQRYDAMAYATVLSYPSVGSWAAHCLRLLSGADGGTAGPNAGRDAGYLGCIAAAAAIHAALPFRIEVPVQDGFVGLPTLGRMAVSSGTSATICSTGPVTTVAGKTLGQGPDWQALRRGTWEADGRTLSVTVDDVDQFRGAPGLPLAPRLPEAASARWLRDLGEAWRILVRHHTAYAEAIGAALVSVVPMVAAPSGHGISATSRESFGAVAISEAADSVMLASALVHEVQHAKLNAVLDLIPLSRPDQSRYYAPWREDPRPLGGLIHGTYAYLGVSDFWRVQRLVPATPHRSYAQLEYARWSDGAARAVATLLASGRLTAAGSRFVERMRDRLATWSVAVPGRPRHLAQVAAADHRLGWRLRNARPDDASVAELAAAWCAGQPAPPHGVTRTDYTDGGIALGSTSRLDLLYLRVRDPGGFTRRLHSDGTAAMNGDMMLISGRTEAAVVAYRRQLANTPASLQAWAGLALALRAARPGPAATALCNGPEVVYAVGRQVAQLTGAAPDPEELARWLAPVIPADDLMPGWFSGQESPSRTR